MEMPGSWCQILHGRMQMLLVTNLEQIKGVKEVAFDNSEDHYRGTNALFEVTFNRTEDDEISKNTKKEVTELLASYDTYVSSPVGSEQEQMDALSKDMNLILVLAVIIIVGVLLLSTKAYMEIPVFRDHIRGGGYF